MSENPLRNVENRLNNFKDTLVPMRNVDGLVNNVSAYLGAIDAEKEWNDDPKEAGIKFLHTTSYTNFMEEDALILLGRTGTGKTSIFRHIYEEIENRRIPQYKYAVIVPFEEILQNLIKAVDDFTSTNVMTPLLDNIMVFINCYVMKALVKKGDKGKKTISVMNQYLRSHNLYSVEDDEYTNSGINKITEMIAASSKMKNRVGDAATNLLVLRDIAEAFLEQGYSDAYQAMKEELKHSSILVLVDTLQEYDLRDVKVVLSIKALIAACFSYYNNAKASHIYMKISLPSEIHTCLVEKLPGKQQGNLVVIQWSNNDLLKMIAIRLLYLYNHGGNDILEFAGKYQYRDFYDSDVNSVLNAKKILYEILPESCPTNLDFTFDTLAYCIRHTLRKPRELMMIFNTFVYKIFEERDSKYFINHPREIANMIHSTQESMILAALSMYTTSYDGILNACEIVLQNRRFYFAGGALNDKLREAEAHRIGYDSEDIKRILLESGLVGKVNDVSFRIMENTDDKHETKESTPENSIRVIKAKFEYQVKGRLSLNRNDYYVIHPMCYEHFECEVGSRSLVYPIEFSDDDEIMRSVRLKDWKWDNVTTVQQLV
jgi:hypothetical protein